MPDEPIAVTLLVIDALDALGVPYLIGGSLASAVHGVLRATMDTDLVADLRLEHAEPLARALGGTFYVDAESIREAVLHQSSFNVIHLETMFKVDVVCCEKATVPPLANGTAHRPGDRDRPGTHGHVATAEDTILAKLDWYRMGGGVSDRQWRDVLGVMKVQADRLDLAYFASGQLN